MKDFDKLSSRQQNIMRFMFRYMEGNGYPPTIREIGEACNINSTSVVNYNLNKLVKAEYLERSNKVSRGLRIIAPIPGMSQSEEEQVVHTTDNDNNRIPVVGHIAAGTPIALPDEAGHNIDEEDFISVPKMLLNGYDETEVFALTVRGDSMIDAMIQNGDIVIVRRQNTANNGDMVAAWLPENNETTLKYFHYESNKGRVRLQPAHPTYEPIFVHPSNCEIKGKVLSVIRSMR
jgi:repressor LexA